MAAVALLWFSGAAPDFVAGVTAAFAATLRSPASVVNGDDEALLTVEAPEENPSKLLIWSPVRLGRETATCAAVLAGDALFTAGSTPEGDFDSCALSVPAACCTTAELPEPALATAGDGEVAGAAALAGAAAATAVTAFGPFCESGWLGDPVTGGATGLPVRCAIACLSIITNGNQATFTYSIDGLTQSKTLTRLLFAPPAVTICR